MTSMSLLSAGDSHFYLSHARDMTNIISFSFYYRAQNYNFFYQVVILWRERNMFDARGSGECVISLLYGFLGNSSDD